VSASLFTNTTLEAYILPAEDGEKVNVTFKVLGLEPALLTLKLIFEDPVAVSPSLEQDSLILNFTDEARLGLYFPNEDAFLHRDSAVLRSKIKKQMVDSDFTRGFSVAADTVEVSLMILMIITFVLNFVLSGGFVHMRMLIRAL